MKLTILDDYNKRNLIRIEYMFLCKRDSLSHATIRSLLSYVLVTACKKYPNNFLLCRALDRLYGAQIGVFSTEGSDTMGMVFYMDFLNPNSLGDNQYTLKECYDIFKEIIYNPLLVDNKFDELVLSQQRDELYDNFISDLEDKLYLSELKSRDHLYESNGGYIDSDGSKKTPVVIHRAILGTLDRFIALYLEMTKGDLPLWLAPVQVDLIPVNNEYHLEFVKDLEKELIDNDIRVKVDDRDEKLGYKMREAQIKKIPLTLVVGDKEKDSKSITYREFGKQDQITVSVDDFINKIKDCIKNKNHNI